MKRLISIIILISIFSTFLCIIPSAECLESDTTAKGDNKLNEMIEKSDGSPIPVSVYFTGIDYEEVEENTIKEVKGKVSDEIIDIAFNGGTNTSLTQKEANKQLNYIVNTQNSVIADMNQENTIEKYNEVFAKSKPEIISCGTYTSYVSTYLTVNQINEVAKSNSVTKMNYTPPDVTVEQKAPIRVSSAPYFVQVPKILKAGTTWTIKISNSSKAKWSSSKKSVAIVNNGRITALNKGDSTIKAELPSGIILSYNVKVSTTPRVNKTTITVKKGKTTKVSLYGKAKSINNRYNNTKYAKIISKSNANTLSIKGLKKGKSNIRITVNGVKTISIRVTVK